MLVALPFLLCLVCGLPPVATARLLRTGTFNIRRDDAASDPLVPGSAPNNGESSSSGSPSRVDGEAPWTERRVPITDQIMWEDLDVVGFQEAGWDQYQDLRALMGDSYDSIGVGRDDGEQAGPAVPLIWKRSELSLVSQEHFWLSDTPDVPGSITWDNKLSRMATMGQFRDLKTSQTVWIMNTHFDHRGPNSRINSANLIKRKVQELTSFNNDLVVLLGDFNSLETDGGYRTLTSGAYTNSTSSPNPSQQLMFADASKELFTRDPREGNAGTSEPPLLQASYGDDYTNPGFPGGELPPKNIDFVFVLDNRRFARRNEGFSDEPGVWNVIEHGILPGTYEGTPTLSDHRLVVGGLYVAD